LLVVQPLQVTTAIRAKIDREGATPEQ
jgi:hypothetical protein